MLLAAPVHGRLTPADDGNMGVPTYAGRWCDHCQTHHGPSFVGLCWSIEILERMVEEGWLEVAEYDKWAMMILDGKDDEWNCHLAGCRFKKADDCPVSIECEHGYDVCPICDPCTCEQVRLAMLPGLVEHRRL